MHRTIPYLFVLYQLIVLASVPVLTYYLHGLSLWPLQDLIFPLCLMVAINLGLYHLIYARIHATDQALGIVVALSLGLTMFGTLHDNIMHLYHTVVTSSRTGVSLGFNLMVLLFVIAVTLRIAACNTISIPLLVVITHIFLVGGIAGILHYHITTTSPQSPVQPTIMPSVATGASNNFPDIYYIIPDGYTSSHMLEKHYDYVNNNFTQELRKRGFFVTDNSNANYVFTRFSIPSALNMDYIQHFATSTDITQLVTSLNKSALFRILQENGYDVLHLPSSFSLARSVGHDVTRFYKNQFPEKDLHLLGDNVEISDLLSFKRFLWQQSVLGHIADAFLMMGIAEKVLDLNYIHYRIQLDLFELLKLTAQVDTSRPRFIFAHWILPHPPFLIDAQGNFRHGLSFKDYRADGGNTMLTRWHTEHPDKDAAFFEAFYREGYANNVRFFNQHILETFDYIHANSKRPFIMIVQGDHGAAYLHEKTDDMSKETMDERFAIFNAYYFPHQDYDDLTPDISPVNSFRIVLNQYFNTTLPLLENQHFYSSKDTPFDFRAINYTNTSKK